MIYLTVWPPREMSFYLTRRLDRTGNVSSCISSSSAMVHQIRWYVAWTDKQVPWLLPTLHVQYVLPWHVVVGQQFLSSIQRLLGETHTLHTTTIFFLGLYNRILYIAEMFAYVQMFLFFLFLLSCSKYWKVNILLNCLILPNPMAILHGQQSNSIFHYSSMQQNYVCNSLTFAFAAPTWH